MAGLHHTDKYSEGVKSAYQMGDLCGIASPTVYTDVYYGDMTKIGVVTIKRVCEGFNCSPADWIITRPDLLGPEGRELRRAREALGLSQEDFAAEFTERAGFQFGADAVNAWESGKAKVRDGIWQAITMALLEMGSTPE